MSTHDRGAFGALLAEAKELGHSRLTFHVDLDVADEDDRWTVCSGDEYADVGRTGEEALRKLVEALRGSKP
jgi:hypothetical protein